MSIANHIFPLSTSQPRPALHALLARSFHTSLAHGIAAPKGPSPEPEFPRASFKDLGANRTVKIVVYSSLAIIGSVETYGWYRWLRSKFTQQPTGKGEDE